MAVNWAGLKNRIGGYHEPENTIFDPTFLKTLDESELRNGVAEILKITSCTHGETFKLLEEHGPQLIKARFAQPEEYSNDGELVEIANRVIRQGKVQFLWSLTPAAHSPRPPNVLFPPCPLYLSLHHPH